MLMKCGVLFCELSVLFCLESLNELLVTYSMGLTHYQKCIK